MTRRLNGPGVALVAAVLMIVAVLAFIQYRSGAWTASYGAYPDEPAHFMGGLMVRDYLASGSLHPVEFAENHYLFQPYFAIGYWPPAFYVVEGAWMLVAGYSRPATMVFTAIIAGLVALLLFSTARRWVPTTLAFVITASFLAIPSVQWSSSVLMTDLSIALLSLAMMLAVGHYFETKAWRWAILAALAGSAALLTKYSAAFIFLPPLLLILIDRRWDILTNIRTWAIVGIVACCCAPWVLWTRRFALIGFDIQPRDLWSRCTRIPEVLHGDLGTVMSSAAVIGLVWALLHWRGLGATQRLLCLTPPCLAVFLILAPTGDTLPRYLMCGYPALLVMIALPIQSLSKKSKVLYGGAILGLFCLSAVQLTTNSATLPTDLTHRVAHELVAAHATGAILVPTSEEGPLIAEMAGQETVRSKLMLIRPSKLMARMNWTGSGYELLVPDARALAVLFEKYPMDVIVLANHRGSPEAPHDLLLREMVAADPRWMLVRQYREPGVEWEVYRRSPLGKPMAPLITLVRSRLRSIQ